MNTGISLSQIQSGIPGSRIVGTESPETIFIESIQALSGSGDSFLSFVASKAYVKDAKITLAKVLLVNEELAGSFPDKILLIVPIAELGLSLALRILHPEPEAISSISPTAQIHPTAKLGKNVQVGHFVCIGAGTEIGDKSILEDGVKIAENVRLGEGARIGRNSVIYSDCRIGKRFRTYGNATIGAEGFGFVFANGIHNKIPQIGKVIIGDDVEVGSNSCIDRGALNDTVIGDGSKFDNQVQIAHNCQVGKNVIVAGQSGLAGSVKLGDNVLIGGACCVSDHIEMEEGTILAGGSALRNSPKKKDVYVGWDLGLNFVDFQKYRVNIKNIVVLNKWIKRIKDLEKKLGIDLPDP